MNSSVPAGWYPDPENAAQVRYWDGQTWTSHTQVRQPSPPATPTIHTTTPTTAPTTAPTAPHPLPQPSTRRKRNLALPIVGAVVAVVIALGILMGPVYTSLRSNTADNVITERLVYVTAALRGGVRDIRVHESYPSATPEGRAALLARALADVFNGYDLDPATFPREVQATVTYPDGDQLDFLYRFESGAPGALTLTVQLAPGEKGADWGRQCAQTFTVTDTDVTLSDVDCR